MFSGRKPAAKRNLFWEKAGTKKDMCPGKKPERKKTFLLVKSRQKKNDMCSGKKPVAKRHVFW
jgi:hypothetical protein